MTEETEHEPDRGTWECKAGDGDWPCEPAKAHMLRTMRPTELAVYQWQALEEACFVLQTRDPKALWDRFLAWSRSPIP